MVCVTRCVKSLDYAERLNKIKEKFETPICTFVGIMSTVLVHATIAATAINYHWAVLLIYIPIFILSFAFAIFLTEGVTDFILMMTLLPGIPLAIWTETKLNVFFEKRLKTQMAA